MDLHCRQPCPLSVQPPESDQPVDTTSVQPPGNSEDRIAPDGAPAPKKLKACILLDLLVGQQVEVLRANNTWSTGYINSIHSDAAEPHFIIRFFNRQWKRVLLREIEAKIRPSSGMKILEDCFTPVGAAHEAKQAFTNSDDDFSDTDCLQACAQYMASQQHTTALCNHVHQ